MRSFDDAMGVSFRMLRDSRVVPGGGAIQTHLARHIRSFALGIPARTVGNGGLCIPEVIPRTLAENAGLDPIDVLLDLSAKDRHLIEMMGLGLDSMR